MKKVIIHWTGGTNQPCQTDLTHYHYIINGDGKKFVGKYKPKDNLNCNDGKYARHCGGGNTSAIGVSMCGMYGFKSAQNIGKYPLTKKQCEATFKLVAELCKKYNIAITPTTVLTHYEFGQAHIKTSSYGKIDIIYLPAYPEITKKEMGDFIRNKVKWYFEKM